MDFVSIAKQAVGHLAHGHLPPRELTSLFISKALGVAILGGACVTKLPQVMTVVRARDTKGISSLSLELELYCGLIHVCYGIYNKLAITAYGEAAVIWLQNLVLLGILYVLRRESILRPAALVTVAALVVMPVALDQVDAQLMSRAYDLNSTIYLVSKIPQIYLAFRQGSTGKLNIVTTFLMFFGSLMRVFTSMREAAGPAMVRGFILGSVVNGTMLFQILYYGANGRKRVAAKQASTKKAA